MSRVLLLCIVADYAIATMGKGAGGRSQEVAHRREWQRKNNASEYSRFWLKAYASYASQHSGKSIYMNWGYHPVTDERCLAMTFESVYGSDDPAHARSHNYALQAGCQMYVHVMQSSLAALKLRLKPLLDPENIVGAYNGLKTLEVGCGRCAGTKYLVEHLRPSEHTGLDLVQEHVDICAANVPPTPSTKVHFVRGTAVSLPFPTAHFDLVLNVESSHTYPSWVRFACGVHRVLRPGGVLAWVDLAGINLGLDPSRVAINGPSMGPDCCGLKLVTKVLELLPRIGFTVLRVEDLLMNVFLSQQDLASKSPTGGREPDGPFKKAFEVYPGSDGWRVLEQQTRHYPMIIAMKNMSMSGAEPSQLCRATDLSH